LWYDTKLLWNEADVPVGVFVPLILCNPLERKRFVMAKCEKCGKSTQFGNNVPHSLHKTKRRWQSNVRKMTITENGRSRKAYICTRCLRTLTKTKGR
jgi:large subunit ribosomal protein L28